MSPRGHLYLFRTNAEPHFTDILNLPHAPSTQLNSPLKRSTPLRERISNRQLQTARTEVVPYQSWTRLIQPLGWVRGVFVGHIDWKRETYIQYIDKGIRGSRDDADTHNKGHIANIFLHAQHEHIMWACFTTRHDSNITLTLKPIYLNLLNMRWVVGRVFFLFSSPTEIMTNTQSSYIHTSIILD